jgi:hypothetical protein
MSLEPRALSEIFSSGVRLDWMLEDGQRRRQASGPDDPNARGIDGRPRLGNSSTPTWTVKSLSCSVGGKKATAIRRARVTGRRRRHDRGGVRPACRGALGRVRDTGGVAGGAGTAGYDRTAPRFERRTFGSGGRRRFRPSQNGRKELGRGGQGGVLPVVLYSLPLVAAICTMKFKQAAGGLRSDRAGTGRAATASTAHPDRPEPQTGSPVVAHCRGIRRLLPRREAKSGGWRSVTDEAGSARSGRESRPAAF